jgi:hypothetical protein
LSVLKQPWIPCGGIQEEYMKNGLEPEAAGEAFKLKVFGGIHTAMWKGPQKKLIMI